MITPATAIVLAVVAGILALAIGALVRRRKSGGCASCGTCAHSGGCPSCAAPAGTEQGT